MEAVLVIEHLTKRFGRQVAVQDLNLTVEAGEIFGFLGPNGAGKTTTIRIILGLLRPSSGRVQVAGFDSWTQHPEAARRFGAVLEAPGFYGYLSGRQNLSQFARVLDRSAERRVDELLELVGLASAAADRVRTYSLGMRQRLAIAQALLGEPALLILDEPTNGLDAIGIYEVRGLLRRLTAERRIAVLLSSHLLSEVQELCHRVAVLDHGFLRARGAVEELARKEGHQLRLVVTDSTRARTVLAGIPGLMVKVGPGEGELRLASSADLAQLVQRRLVLAGVGVTELRTVSARLEDFFLELTGGSVPVVPLATREEESWTA
jgi:ABC-2 type transport system ATP-binding protein